MEKKKPRPPAISLGFWLLGLGLFAIAEAISEEKTPPTSTETEDLGYAVEVDQKNLPPSNQ